MGATAAASFATAEVIIANDFGVFATWAVTSRKVS